MAQETIGRVDTVDEINREFDKLAESASELGISIKRRFETVNEFEAFLNSGKPLTFKL